MKRQKLNRVLNGMILALLCGHCALIGNHLAGVAQAESEPELRSGGEFCGVCSIVYRNAGDEEEYLDRSFGEFEDCEARKAQYESNGSEIISYEWEP